MTCEGDVSGCVGVEYFALDFCTRSCFGELCLVCILFVFGDVTVSYCVHIVGNDIFLNLVCDV